MTVLRTRPPSIKKADVVIVGSGIAPMSVGYELAKAGNTLVVLDCGSIGKGMSSRNHCPPPHNATTGSIN